MSRQLQNDGYYETEKYVFLMLIQIATNNVSVNK